MDVIDAFVKKQIHKTNPRGKMNCALRVTLCFRLYFAKLAEAATERCESQIYNTLIIQCIFIIFLLFTFLSIIYWNTIPTLKRITFQGLSVRQRIGSGSVLRRRKDAYRNGRANCLSSPSCAACPWGYWVFAGRGCRRDPYGSGALALNEADQVAAAGRGKVGRGVTS